MCKRCACFLFWISFSATPWENHCCIWCWIRYHLPKVLLGRTQPVAPELVCLLLRMLRILFLLGWGRKRQRYFVKAHEVLEFCLWESSVTSMAGGSVPSLLGVRNSQISGVSLSQECPQHGCQQKLGSLKTAFLQIALLWKNWYFTPGRVSHQTFPSPRALAHAAVCVLGWAVLRLDTERLTFPLSAELCILG